jgi:hypothetical protein
MTMLITNNFKASKGFFVKRIFTSFFRRKVIDEFISIIRISLVKNYFFINNSVNIYPY